MQGWVAILAGVLIGLPAWLGYLHARRANRRARHVERQTAELQRLIGPFLAPVTAEITEVRDALDIHVAQELAHHRWVRSQIGSLRRRVRALEAA